MTYGVSWASVPLCGNTHRSRGTPRRSAASAEHTISRGALLDSVVGVHELRVREPDHAVVRPGRRDLLGCVRPLDPGVGVAGGYVAEAAPTASAMWCRCSVGVRPAAARKRRLEHRVHLHRHARCRGPARRVRSSSGRSPSTSVGTWPSPCARPRRAPAGAPVAPSACATPRPRPRAPRRRDRRRCRRTSGSAATAACCRPSRVQGVAQRGADALGDQRRRGRGSATTGWRRPARSRPRPAPAGGAPASSAATRERLGEQVDRLACRIALVGAVVHLAGADDHGRTGVECTHRRGRLGVSGRVTTIRRIEILFICTGNICRSPMAEVHAAHPAGASAASTPRSRRPGWCRLAVRCRRRALR